MKSYFQVSNSQKFVKTVERESLLINEIAIDSLTYLVQEGVGRMHAAFWLEQPELLHDACRNYSAVRRGNDCYIGLHSFCVHNLPSFLIHGVVSVQIMTLALVGFCFSLLSISLEFTADQCAGTLKLH